MMERRKEALLCYEKAKALSPLGLDGVDQAIAQINAELASGFPESAHSQVTRRIRP